MLAREERFHRVGQNRVGPRALQSARLPQGKDSFDPALPSVALRAQASLSPEHCEAEHSFSVVVRRRYALLPQEETQAIHLVPQPADQLPGIILSIAVHGHQANETRVKHVPLAHRGRRFGHAAQPPQFLPRPCPAARQFRVAPLCEPLGLTDEVRQATLPQPHPVAVDGVPVADQDSGPVLDQRFEGCPGALGVSQLPPAKPVA